MTPFDIFQSIITRELWQRGMKPLRKETEIATLLAGGGPFTLVKTAQGMELQNRAPSSPDLTVTIPEGALTALDKINAKELSELGIEIVKLMAHADPALKIKVKVHIGILSFVTHGYLGILPLGGAELMRYLASRGFGNLSKIKEAITNLRGER